MDITQKIKILYIITKSDIGGAQKYVSDLASTLDKNQFEPKIFYGGKDIKWLSNRMWPWALFLNDWLAIFELVRILKKERANVIHLNSSKAGVVGAMAAAVANLQLTTNNRHQIKVVFTAHGWVFNPTNAISWPVRQFYILLQKFVALFQDAIICVSEYDYHLALRYRIAQKEKLITIHNGIDPDIKFLSREKAREEILKKLPITNYQLPINSLWIGSLGRLVKEKNYETFIAAAAEIKRQETRDKRRGTIFILIGEGKEKDKLQALITHRQLQDSFFIIEPTGNDAKYLKAFDIFVMTSIKEGLPYVLLEAMAAELPIVVTDAGGTPEMIKNHENGLMVAQKNPDMLTKSLSGVIENKNIAGELAKNARQIVKTKFNLEEMVRRTTDVYRENL